MFIASVLIITYYDTKLFYCLLFYVGLAIYFSLPNIYMHNNYYYLCSLAFEGISEV